MADPDCGHDRVKRRRRGRFHRGRPSVGSSIKLALVMKGYRIDFADHFLRPVPEELFGHAVETGNDPRWGGRNDGELVPPTIVCSSHGALPA